MRQIAKFLNIDNVGRDFPDADLGQTLCAGFDVPHQSIALGLPTLAFQRAPLLWRLLLLFLTKFFRTFTA